MQKDYDIEVSEDELKRTKLQLEIDELKKAISRLKIKVEDCNISENCKVVRFH